MRFLLPLALTCLATASHAIGLGAPAGTPTLGRPLRLEIPLIGHSGPPLSADCFHLTPVPGSPDELYFPRHVRAYAETIQGKPTVVVLANAVTQPVVEFRLTIGCSFALARDFTLLTSLPTLEAAKPAAPAPAQPPVAAPYVEAPSPPKNWDTLPLQKTTNLEALAREKYPAQPKAREKFKRMMQAANPTLVPAGAEFDLFPLPAGTALQIPPGLPERRYGPYVAPATPPGQPKPRLDEAPKPAPARAATPKAPPAPRQAPPAKDRLVLDAAAAPPLSPAEADAELARLESIHTEQAKAQEALDERIARAQEAFDEIKQYVLQTEARIKALEEQNREQERRNREAQIWQLAVAVLLGGALGAGMLRAYTRLTRRHRQEETPPLLATPASPAPPATPVRTQRETSPPSDPVTIAMEPPPPPPTTPVEPASPLLEPLDFDFTPASGTAAPKTPQR